MQPAKYRVLLKKKNYSNRYNALSLELRKSYIENKDSYMDITSAPLPNQRKILKIVKKQMKVYKSLIFIL